MIINDEWDKTLKIGDHTLRLKVLGTPYNHQILFISLDGKNRYCRFFKPGYEDKGIMPGEFMGCGEYLSGGVAGVGTQYGE